MTVLDFFTAGAVKAGIIQPTQTPSGAQLHYIGERSREMIRTWSSIRNRLFFIPEAAYPLAAGVGVYKIGPGAGAAPNFETSGPNPLYTRPLLIQSGVIIVGTARRYPLGILSRPAWDAVQTRTLQDPDGPTDLFYDFQHPIATLNFAPIPLNNSEAGGGTGTVFLSQWNPLPIFQDTDVKLNVEDYYPDDYITALTSGLAIQLCSSYGRPVPQDVLGIFQSAIAVIENKNQQKVASAMGPSRTLQIPTKGDMVTPAPQTQVPPAGQ